MSDTSMSKVMQIDRKDEKVRFGASMPRHLVFEIDKVRGDTNRSLWLQRLAIRELELHPKRKQVVEGQTFMENDSKK